MEKTIKVLAMLMLVLFSACAAGNKTVAGGGGDDKKTSASASKAKTEDLSAYRPKFTPVADASGTTTSAATAIAPSNHVNDRVAVLMDTIASTNRKIKYAQGFRILVYSGSQRETVTNIRKSIIRRVPEEKDYLSYKQPTYRLKVGDYFNRLEAQQVLQQIKDIAPQAIIVPDQINIR